ncbi:acetylornithine deacetylase [Halobacterium hubeiense]|uniref:Putative [LysW]-lysine/[LysW]-ornithine hydrolase n=1 Tax=Halobacterium hubeiense TaxID=1407499 RepID=A0A0U5H644_9EURY|nr:[LysW]-lysine hydrolase [Halobacterium hubeiense]CQH62140.1 acetylornithine deacetylase [Halobacterium hubeiense]
MTPRELLRDLVATPSVSGAESEAAGVLVDYFERHGREAWTDDAGNVRAPGDDSVLLTSHVDTVPGYIDVREENGKLWGRGSVDATGPLAAMAAASVETGASFAGVVEEETTSAGARHLVADRAEPDAVVNGEPSGWDALTLGYRGLVAGTYEVATESGHSSRPEPNAVQLATAWTERVRAAFPDDDTVFESVTVKPVSFDGGLADDGTAVEATVEMQFRLPPGTTADDVYETVADCTERGSVTWTESIPPVMASPRTPVAGALRAGIREAGGDPTHLRKTGTSDANIYAGAWDCPVATYGPGDSNLDHAPDERIDLAAFDRGVEVLTTAADRLCTS